VDKRLNRILPESITLRTRSEVTMFFDGLDLMEPGIVQASKWRPLSESEAAAPATLWVGVAQKT
jgi:hypothetical protein